MKRLLLIAAVPLLLTGAARAEEEMAYVIKVTPTLAYLDVGRAAGAIEGGVYLILREDGERRREVGRVQLVRVDASFSIGEIIEIAADESIEVLDRVVLQSVWEATGATAEASAMEPAGGQGRPAGRRSLQVLLGADWGGKTDLTYALPTQPNAAPVLLDAKSATGLAIGLRLGQAFSDKWRVNLSYRMGKGEDVTQLAIEADLHLLPRGYDQAGFYFGAGAGMHQLSWDPPGNADGSANKTGANLMVGVQAPRAMNLVLEAGYQRVVKFDDLLDVSNVRTYLGFGRRF